MSSGVSGPDSESSQLIFQRGFQRLCLIGDIAIRGLQQSMESIKGLDALVVQRKYRRRRRSFVGGHVEAKNPSSLCVLLMEIRRERV
jgi:hypothetical protein